MTVAFLFKSAIVLLYEDMKNMELRPGHTESAVVKAKERERMTMQEKMKSVIARISSEVNKEAGERYGLTGLVNDSLHIDTAHFSKDKGGIYEDTDITDDKGTVDALDRYNCAADNLNTKKFYKEQHGIETPEGIVAKHLVNRGQVPFSFVSDILITCPALPAPTLVTIATTS